MTNNERNLLLTVARLVRAHLADHMNHPDVSDLNLDQDWADINESLAPFDPAAPQRREDV